MIKEAIQALVVGKSLSMDEAAQVMSEIMEGQVTPAQFGAFVTALRLKGETVEEIAGLAKTMRAKAIQVRVKGPVVDTCGTGGDGSATFNISTVAAFVVAGAGLKVAKHGNRAMSSQCGSADVLEALGVKIELTAQQVERCLEEIGIGFMFAPAFHPAMKYAAAPRREIGIRTVFNILGPLTNPARAAAQVIGVYDGALTAVMAEVLKELGAVRAFVVHGEDGLDELSTTGESRVAELRGGQVRSYIVRPEDFGLPRARMADLQGGSAAENAEIIRRILAGERGAKRDIVVLNAGAGIAAGGKAADIAEGIGLAERAIDSGAAQERLARLVEFCQG